MLWNNRIFVKQGSTLKDVSVSLNNILGQGEVLALGAGDVLYLASDFPFNHRYFEIKTANDQAAAPTVTLWTGGEWLPAVDVVDQTMVTGQSLAQSGILSWVPDRDRNTWTRYVRSSDIPELASTKIYDSYWAKLSFSAPLGTLTEVRYIGHKFSNDADLKTEYPDLLRSDLMSAFDSAKTSWLEQTISAAEYIIQDMREKGVIISPSQILDPSIFKRASIHKTAAIIMQSFGADYKDAQATAEARYRNSLNIKAYSVDQDETARLDVRKETRFAELLGR